MSIPLKLRPRFWAPALLASLGIVALARAQSPAGAPASGAPPVRPEVRAFAAAEGRWAWLKDVGEETELYVAEAAAPGRLRAKGQGWAEVALQGGEVWLVSRAGSSGELLRLSWDGEAPPEAVYRAGSLPGALHLRDGRAYWLEMAPARDPGLAFVPTLGARLRLLCREGSGAVRVLLERPVVEGEEPAPGDLVGVAGGQLYLRLRSVSGTEFLSLPLEGGRPTRIAGEAEEQQALLHGDRLYWTAPSEEATPESGIRCLRRLTPEGKPETVVEWIPAYGDLLATDEGMVYLRNTNVYRLPTRFGLPEYVRKAEDGRRVSDGHSLVLLEAAEPRRLPAQGARP